MKEHGALSIVGAGMVTALGHSAQATSAGLIGRIRAVQPDNLWDRSAAEQLVVGRPRLHQWWEGRELLAVLAASAVEECAASAQTNLHADAANIPIAELVAPAWRPWRWPALEQLALSDLERCLARPLPAHSRLMPYGRTGFYQALQWARELLYSASAPDCCIVVGVESFLRQVLADEYAQQRRLFTSANSNGFCPGESAAAVLIARSGAVRVPELAILGAGFANDPSLAGGTEQAPVNGNGLTEAMRQSLKQAKLQLADMDLRLSDANGEHFKFREITIADSRLHRLRAPSKKPRRLSYFEHWHPIEYVGEVGAAIMPLLLGHALDAGVQQALPGELAIAHSSEDNGDRMALVVEYRPVE